MSALWQQRKVIVTVGTGGVGKTSVSAAFGLAAAVSGLRTLVMTIDPARRLANALGLGEVGSSEHQVDSDALARLGARPKAPFSVMMPDVRRTFDELIERTATSDEQRRRILGNRIYQQFASALAGSHEYAAVETLYEIYRSGRYDLIVVDTPPAQSALEFLSAPGRIVGFLDQESVQWLLRPYLLASKVSLRLFSLGSSLVFRTLGRLAGVETMRALAEFLIAFQGMYEGFVQRSRDVQRLLGSEELGFVLVGVARGPEYAALRGFYQTLVDRRLPPRAIIVNRMHPLPYARGLESELRWALARALPDPVTCGEVLMALREELALAQQDQQARGELSRAYPDVPVLGLPELPRDVHDLESLVRLHRYFLPA